MSSCPHTKHFKLSQSVTKFTKHSFRDGGGDRQTKQCYLLEIGQKTELFTQNSISFSEIVNALMYNNN